MNRVPLPSRAAAAFALAVLVACPREEPAPDAGPAVATPDQVCPGAGGCLRGGEGEPLLVGAAKRDVTPPGFEVAKAQYLKGDRPDFCEPTLPVGAEGVCGELKSNIYDDCGTDALCFGAPGYPGPDEDGSEGDGKPDWFWDCGRDGICPPPHDSVERPWPGPDADGSEGDGVFQGLWIAGYGNSRPAMGVKDPVWARALVLVKGDVTVAFVTIDAVGLFYDETLRVRARLEEERPGAIDLVLLQTTHTHEGPDTLGQWGLEDPYAGLQFGHGRDDKHMELIREQSVAAVLEALDGAAPARVRAGTVNTHVEGMLHDSRDPQIFDDTLTALLFTREDDGATIATVSHWGNHPESLDSRNNFISSDYAHALRKGLEEGLPATERFAARPGLGGVAIYQQGLVGGLMGPNGFVITGRDGTAYENRYKTFARTDAYGELLAEQTFAAVDNAEDISGALSFARVVYRAPVDNQAYHVGLFNGWFDRALYVFDEGLPIDDENKPWLETEVSLVRLGPLRWLTAPGELFPETWVGFGAAQSFGRPQVSADNPNPPDLAAAPGGPYLRERVGGAYPMLLGLTPDETGYLVPPYDFKLHPVAPWISQAPGDHYEETNSIGLEGVPRYLAAVEVVLGAFPD
jgi:hypothetical protein